MFVAASGTNPIASCEVVPTALHPILPRPIPHTFNNPLSLTLLDNSQSCSLVRLSAVRSLSSRLVLSRSMIFQWVFLTHSLQSFRKYSAEAPKAAESAPKKSNLTPVYVGVGLAGLGAGLYRYYGGEGKSTVELKDRPKVFNGESWVDLKLANIETLSHNTKRLRFEYDDKEAVSGMPVACESSP